MRPLESVPTAQVGLGYRADAARANVESAVTTAASAITAKAHISSRECRVPFQSARPTSAGPAKAATVPPFWSRAAPVAPSKDHTVSEARRCCQNDEESQETGGGGPGTGGERAEGNWGPKRSKGKLEKQSDPHWHDVNILI
jgi:hypothetical protein